MTNPDNFYRGLNKIYAQYQHPRRFNFDFPGQSEREMFEFVSNLPSPWIASVRGGKANAHAIIVERIIQNKVYVSDPWGVGAPGIGRGITATIGWDQFWQFWWKSFNKGAYSQ